MLDMVAGITGATTNTDELAIWIPDSIDELLNATLADIVFPSTIVDTPVLYPPLDPPIVDDGTAGLLGGIIVLLNNILDALRELAQTISMAIGGTPDPGFGDEVLYVPTPPDDFIFDFSSIMDNMPNFIDYFPFSIPFDLYNTFRVMSGNMPIEALGMTRSEYAEFVVFQAYGYEGITPTFTLPTTRAPTFEFPMPEIFNYTLVIDLEDFRVLIDLIRWIVLLSFAFGLYKMTPKVLTW